MIAPFGDKGQGMFEARHRNRILNLLPDADFQRLAQEMECVRLPVRTSICAPGEPLEHAYFPLDGVISAVIVLSDGAAIEALAIGCEGMAGTGLLVDETVSAYRVIQQVEGTSVRVPIRVFQSVIEDSLPARRILERYLYTLLRNCAQNAACNLHHNVEERMCRWLLASADRVGGDEFYITQEFLGEMLGVRRQSVNLTAGYLQQAGLIRYRRGNLQILDRSGLEQAACECYQVTTSHYEQLMHVPGNGM